MKPVGLDIGTNYTKTTADGKEVLTFPSLVVFGEERDWSLKASHKDIYIGDEALTIVQNVENVEILRPLHEGRVMHKSYLELAKHALKTLDVNDAIIATGLPVKSSRKEREDVVKSLETELKAKVLLFPEPVGTMAHMGVETGVCIDIGFGTTDIVVISHMEYLKGDTLLMGVDRLYENLEVTVRNKAGISLTPEEMTMLLMNENFEIGRIRGGKRISVSHGDIIEDYRDLMVSWAERIANRAKMIVEGLSTTIVDNIILTGGGSALPGVFEEFRKSFEDVGTISTPKDPMKANALGYYTLAKVYSGETPEEKAETPEEQKDQGKEESKKKKK
ncbi:Actin-like ATPase involved in cell morphogenesis [Archaeoglobus sulfaticallidus PM70-1]|uniref:Actin-like ATPase involved in cell morphogenesis n=1 Tax=Archaeoglobus sulfaticallidus PM70-1 TaxID=387631 RepID=N0BNH1_9EURY|nr:rod shape-determining protein [Archaeoglobus sulfaticallidus]AGK61865.1 Actin-like ATPase involved in cell morphogenesis [Archaeoglobus sulfaticallidus PM70-1]